MDLPPTGPLSEAERTAARQKWAADRWGCRLDEIPNVAFPAHLRVWSAASPPQQTEPLLRARVATDPGVDISSPSSSSSSSPDTSRPVVVSSPSRRDPETVAKDRRWSQQQLADRLAGTTGPRFEWLDADVLSDLAAGYTAITGQRLTSNAQRNLLNLISQVHGPDTLPLTEILFASTGTTANLLGMLRSHPPRIIEPARQEPPVDDPGDDAQPPDHHTQTDEFASLVW